MPSKNTSSKHEKDIGQLCLSAQDMHMIESFMISSTVWGHVGGVQLLEEPFTTFFSGVATAWSLLLQ